MSVDETESAAPTGRSAPVRLDSDPKSRGTWRRYNTGTGHDSFHAGEENASSFVTHCNGRWSLQDQADHVEHSDNPPHDDRCDACVRVRIERLRVEQGLAELVENTVDPNNRFGFDHGGEA